MQSLAENVRDLVRQSFDLVFGAHFRSHRIPFGAIAGYYIYMKPSISPRMFVGVDETSLARAATLLIREGDTVYDVGAHIGYTSILFAKLVGKSGNVESFELMPSTAEVLRESLDLNGFGQCRIHVVGLANCERKLVLSRGSTYMGSLEETANLQGGEENEECIIVRLDDYRCNTSIPLPTFIKMDVEHAEVEALYGAEKTILEANPMLFIEFHSLSLLRDGLRWLNALGYQIRLLSGQIVTWAFTAELESFHDTVLCYNEDSRWHSERLQRWRAFRR